MEKKIIRIGILGPESTGKSTLAEALALHFQTRWIPEFARKHPAILQRDYTIDDVLYIAQQQLKEEQASLSNCHNFLFIDTELINAKVWCEEVFGSVPEWIQKNLPIHRYDHYLLTFPDLPWVFDPLRENEHRRDYLFDRYKEELNHLNASYSIITGMEEDRLLNAIQAVEKFHSTVEK